MDDSDSGSEGPGGLSECDERNGEEREYAKATPEKGNQRLASKVYYIDSCYLD